MADGADDADELISVPAEARLETDARARGRESGGPASTRDVRRAYLDQAVIGYVIYLVGAVTAFLAVALALSDAQAGLHSSALAIGSVAAGLTSHRLDRLLGARSVRMGALVLLTLAAALLVWAPAFGATLAAAAGCGFGAGILFAHAAQTLSAGGGALARVRLARSTLIAMLSSLAVPLLIGTGIAIGLGWRFVVVPAMILIGIALVATSGRVDRRSVSSVEQGRLPSSYWLPWFLVVLVVAAEFAIVFWGSTLVERQAGVTLADATLTISAFIAGAIVGRIGLSTHVISGRDPVLLMRGGIILALLGSLLTWGSTTFEVSALGMFLGGMGLGVLYPLAAAIALATAPRQPAVAAARLVLASGLAILVAPFVLGVAADLIGVAAAWLLIPAIYLASLALTVPVARSPRVGATEPASRV